MDQIILSIGMIVKNEVRCLEKCIKALEPLRAAVPCELVIADTGSTDGTREIAARYADIFFDYKWENDFAAARNAVLAKCSGKWYLSIDADEYLDPEIDDFIQLLRDPALSDREETCGVITICNYKDRSLDKSTATSFLALRFAKITPNTHYVGKIHESIVKDDTKPVLDLSFIIFWHDGYVYQNPQKAQQKTERNMTLLEKEIEKKPHDPLTIVQCIESSRDVEEKLKYIYWGLREIRIEDPAWDCQGPSVLRYAVQMGASIGLPQIFEWAEMAFKNYPHSHVTQIDINAMLAQYYMRCCEWNKALKASDAYWDGIQKLERGEFPIADFARVLAFYEPQYEREHMALIQADACIHLKQFQLAKKVLKKVPLDTIAAGHIETLVGLFARLSKKIDISDLLIPTAKKILDNEPQTREEWIRQDVLRPALSNLFQLLPDKSEVQTYRILSKLNDNIYAPAVEILDTEDNDKIYKIAETIFDWRYIPNAVIQKLIEQNIQFPHALFETIDFEGVEKVVSYLINHMEDPLEQLLHYVNGLNSDHYSIVWKFFILTGCCMWNNWKNEALSTSLYNAYYAAATEFMDTVYSEQLLTSDAIITLLPQNCRFAYYCIQAECAAQAGDSHCGIEYLKKAVHTAKNMKEMVQFLNHRMESVYKERQIAANITPELVVLAKQIRNIVAQYPQDDPQIFVLKNSEQYQKMKFLIENPNLDNM